MIRRCVLFLGVLPILQIAGCPVLDDRLTNQGGGSLASAIEKINRGRMSALTPDEVQILGDAASELSPEIDVFITDEQGQAAIDFLVVNEVNTFEDVVELARLNEENPDAVVVPQSLQSLIDSGITGGDIIDVSDDAGVQLP